ncbi:unnamed protein product [Spirodela intermedia]|uniref:Uncharacterized protein n=1 Tax=Spirodela intermedia TaxID=51605 RepID=A0A7I8L371_SPIIN|nr:unnamed protein product [Spirodela intermedia]
MPVHEAELAAEAPPPPAGGDPTVAGHAPPSSPTSLYVGDLQLDVTEDQLLAMFARIGVIASIRICRDAVTGASLGYAYVNFVSSEDAICALEALNHTAVNGKPIRIMWSHRDSDVRKSGIGNLFVKNLAESIDSIKLQEIFSRFGKILSCKVATSPGGKSKCHGYVQFDTQESANAALQELHEACIEGKKIRYVTNFIKRSERVVPSSDANYTNLYVKNLDQDITEELLHLKFSEFGKITSVAIAVDSTGSSRGFGFVNYESPGSAKTAVETMNGMQLGRTALYVARAQKKAEREKILGRLYGASHNDSAKNMASNVYVKNIYDSVSDDDLREHFMMRDDKGVSKGFGFVCFSSADEAKRASTESSLFSMFSKLLPLGFMFHGKPLYVAIAQRKQERQTHLRLRYAQMMSGFAAPSSGVIHAGYPPIYYPPPGPNLMYQPVPTRPGWMIPNGFVPPTKLGFQAPSPPMVSFFLPYIFLMCSGHLLKWGSEGDNVPIHQMHDLADGLAVSAYAASKSQGVDVLRTMLASASPQQQKQMLGEHLFPLSHLAAKITGMLLEMDNWELLLLLESPHSLAAKVDEAAQVLKISKAKSGRR